MIICYYFSLFIVTCDYYKDYDQYNAQNKEAFKKNSRERYKNLSQAEKDKIKEYQRKKYEELV